jgi:hypothetical protein
MGPTATVLMLGVIALVAAVSLCAFDRHDDAAGLHGCLPLVVTTLSALAAMPLLTSSAASVSLIPAPRRRGRFPIPYSNT